MGSQLLVYELSTGRMMLNHTIFSSGVHIHGIHAVQLPEAWLLAVHGERFVTVRICSLSKAQSRSNSNTQWSPLALSPRRISCLQVLKLSRMQSGSAISVQDMFQVGPLTQWSMDCKLSLLCSKSTDLGSSITKPSAGQAMLAVGLSDDAVEMYDLSIGQANMVRNDMDTGGISICTAVEVYIEYCLHHTRDNTHLVTQP